MPQNISSFDDKYRKSDDYLTKMSYIKSLPGGDKLPDILPKWL